MFSGGYVGVDVFFVISGYLITTTIVNDIAKDRFSFYRFYERRARRILPALFLVMFVCLPFAWVWMLPSQLVLFSEGLIAVSVFLSNFLFWRESGYFAASTEENPLLHTWSLSVEEQFYLIFPILLIFGWRFGQKRVLWAMCIVAGMSLLLSEWGWRNAGSSNYYLIPFRAWELLVGSIAALLAARKEIKASNILSSLGLTAIALPIFFYDKNTPFPSLYALLPVLGAASVILFAGLGTWPNALMRTKAFVGIGLISYSAYLWHQPLFAFARIRLEEAPSIFLMIALSAASLVLAVFSWKFVEKPFRIKGKGEISARVVAYFSIFGLLLFIGLGLVGLLSNGMISRFGADKARLVRILDDPAVQSHYVTQRYLKYSKSKRNWDDSDKPNILMIGDSYSQDFYNALVENGFDKKIDLLLKFVPVRCGTLFVKKELLAKVTRKKDINYCAKQNPLLDDEYVLDKLSTADQVWLVSSWRESHISVLADSIQKLSTMTDAEILVVGRKRFIPLKQSHLRMSKEQRANYIADIVDDTKASRDIAMAAGFGTYLELQTLMCGSTFDTYDQCKPFDAEGMPKSYDGGHLTRFGAVLMGALIEPKLECQVFGTCDK